MFRHQPDPLQKATKSLCRFFKRRPAKAPLLHSDSSDSETSMKPEVVHCVAMQPECARKHHNGDSESSSKAAPVANSSEESSAVQQEQSSTSNSKRTDYLSWDEFFIGVALLAAQRSKDPSTQVGAVIADENNIIVGVGYNGMPRGCHDDHMPWGKHDSNRLNQKYYYVCHAEMNAVLNTNTKVRGATVYVTLFPCNECAKLLIQSGIKRVVYMKDKPEKEQMQASKHLFKMAGVEFVLYQPIRSDVVIHYK